jgi:hypothetical protein
VMTDVVVLCCREGFNSAGKGFLAEAEGLIAGGCEIM